MTYGLTGPGRMYEQVCSTHLLLGRVAAHIQEVGGRATVQLDDVHGGHGQAGTWGVSSGMNNGVKMGMKTHAEMGMACPGQGK
jgi:hypothetical protein